MEKAIEVIKKIIEKREIEFENMETVSAPSGEWEAYNIDYLLKEASIDSLYDLINELEGEDEI